MALNKAIMLLLEMRESSMMPTVFKVYINDIIETVSQCEEPSTQPEKRTEERTETHGVCLDAISRQQAIDAVHKNYDAILDFTSDGQTISSSIEDILSELPSAQPEQRWIPVSERLPDDLAEVNVTWVNHKPEPYYDFVKDKPFTASAVYYKGNWYWYSSVCTDLLAEYGENEIDKIDDAIEITAWTPLPDPYQKRGDQNGMEK